MTVRLTARPILAAVAAGALLCAIFGVAAGPSALASEPVTGDPVVVAVGDFACDPADRRWNDGGGTAAGCQQAATSNQLLTDTTVDAILALGDYQYECGDLADYAASYDPTWGRLDPLMDPTAGNREYQTGTDALGVACPTDNATAQNYFAHFGAAAHPVTSGHFSFDLGSWHLIALNANCGKAGVGGCGASSAQTKWLKADLAATKQPCIAAYWHQPLWTGLGSNLLAYAPWWNALYAAHADLVLNGHIHNYQRFSPLSPAGAVDPGNGITEYIVGTGGEALQPIARTAAPQPVAYSKTFGYLRMTLHSAGWDAQFIDSSGAVLDTSAGTCHPN
ncbi:MAG: hypothetical protein QOI51_2451 [Nocardioidaceae bacterium]|jgi:hypothetical protein|nr:hypothetical protein [Nocardioidaceae bacterium]